jgi:hypothetical protein
LDDRLGVLGFVKCQSEYAFYYRGARGDRFIVGVYVDDLIITGPSTQGIKKFKLQMVEIFKMSDLGLLTYYLGIEVKQDSGGITLSQGCYAKKILEKSGLEECNPCQVPMQVKLKLKKESDSPKVDATGYRSTVGSLRYLVHTRPELAFVVGYVSRYIEEPHEEHLTAIKHILRYIAGIVRVGVFYPRKEGDERLVGYTDSDLAGDLDTRKSTSGVIFFLGKSPIN